MNAGSANWTWPEVEAVLLTLARSDTDLVVCGGQAVAFWARRFELLPVASRDLDLLGDQEAARQVANLLGAVVQFPSRYDMTIITAVTQVVWQGHSLRIEWLSSVPGIETDPEAISVVLSLSSNIQFRILHPMALIMAKLHAVRFFDQQDRQDEAHLRIVWTAARLWMDGLVLTEAPWVLRLTHQWYRVVRQPGNRRVLDRLQLDWRSLIPLASLRNRAGEDDLVARFLSEHWPRLAEV